MTDVPMCLSFSSHFFGFDWVVYYYSTLHVMTLLVCKIVNDLRQQNRWKIKPAAAICLKFCDRKRHSCPKNLEFIVATQQREEFALELVVGDVRKMLQFRKLSFGCQ